MLLIFDLDEYKITQAVGISAALTHCEAKRGSGQQIAVHCVRAGEKVELEPGEQLYFVGKKVGEYDADAAVYANAFVYDEGSQLYRTPISFINEVLDDLFKVDGNPENDRPSIQLMVELGHRLSNSHPWNRSENYVLMVLHNNVGRDDDAAPDINDPESVIWLDGMAVRHDAAQSLSDAAATQARENLKMVYDAAKGGVIMRLADGSDIFFVASEVPV